VDVTGGDPLCREHDRFEAGAAHLIDRQGGDVIGESAAKRGLPRRILSFACRDDVAHDAFVDNARIDARASHYLGDHERAELRRGELLERAEELAGRRAYGADDDGVSHDALT